MKKRTKLRRKKEEDKEQLSGLNALRKEEQLDIRSINYDKNESKEKEILHPLSKDKLNIVGSEERDLTTKNIEEFQFVRENTNTNNLKYERDLNFHEGKELAKGNPYMIQSREIWIHILRSMESIDEMGPYSPKNIETKKLELMSLRRNIGNFFETMGIYTSSAVLTEAEKTAKKIFYKYEIQLKKLFDGYINYLNAQQKNSTFKNINTFYYSNDRMDRFEDMQDLIKDKLLNPGFALFGIKDAHDNPKKTPFQPHAFINTLAENSNDKGVIKVHKEHIDKIISDSNTKAENYNIVRRFDYNEAMQNYIK